MRDKRVRHRELEKDALYRGNVAAFVFTGGQASAEDTVSAVGRLLQKFVNIATSEPKPFLYTFRSYRSLTRVRLRPPSVGKAR